MRTGALLLTVLMLTGCAVTQHPTDGALHRDLAQCHEQHAYDRPEACVPMQAVVNGDAIAAGLLLAAYVAVIILLALAGGR